MQRFSLDPILRLPYRSEVVSWDEAIAPNTTLLYANTSAVCTLQLHGGPAHVLPPQHVLVPREQTCVVYVADNARICERVFCCARGVLCRQVRLGGREGSRRHASQNSSVPLSTSIARCNSSE